MSMTKSRQDGSSFGVLKNDRIVCHNASAAAVVQQMAGTVAHVPPMRTLQKGLYCLSIWLDCLCGDIPKKHLDMHQEVKLNSTCCSTGCRDQGQ